MFGRVKVYQVDCLEPEVAVLARLDNWREEHPNATIVGMHWDVTAKTAVCILTYEEPAPPVPTPTMEEAEPEVVAPKHVTANDLRNADAR